MSVNQAAKTLYYGILSIYLFFEDITSCSIKDWADESICNNPTGNDYFFVETVIYICDLYGSITPFKIDWIKIRTF
jgi:hypothetical protein